MPQDVNVFPYFQSEPLLFQHLPTAVPPALHLCAGDTSLMSLRHQVTDLLQSCVCSRLPQPLTAGQVLPDHPGSSLITHSTVNNTSPILRQPLPNFAEFHQVSVSHSPRLFRSICSAALPQVHQSLPSFWCHLET